MKTKVSFWGILLCCLFCSCNSQKQLRQMDAQTEWFLSEQAIGYWDIYYRFPTTYLQARDTQAWYFVQCKDIDSMLLGRASEIMFKDYDTALLITFQDDTLAFVPLPCACDYDDRIPYGLRAFDSLNCLILEDRIMTGENSSLDRLTYDLINELQPVIEREMSKKGYTLIQDKDKKHPPYLLVEYLSKTDSIQLVKVCQKHASFFYDDYAGILKKVLSEYCRTNHVSRLLIFAEIYTHEEHN